MLLNSTQKLSYGATDVELAPRIVHERELQAFRKSEHVDCICVFADLEPIRGDKQLPISRLAQEVKERR